jgi:hypothetical protein
MILCSTPNKVGSDAVDLETCIAKTITCGRGESCDPIAPLEVHQLQVVTGSRLQRESLRLTKTFLAGEKGNHIAHKFVIQMPRKQCTLCFLDTGSRLLKREYRINPPKCKTSVHGAQDIISGSARVPTTYPQQLHKPPSLGRAPSARARTFCTLTGFYGMNIDC